MSENLWIDHEKLADHQRSALMGLRVYPWVGPQGERQSALIWAATGGGKTVLALALGLDRGFSRRTLVVCPGINTAKRYAQELAKHRGSVWHGDGVPDRIPILSSERPVSKKRTSDRKVPQNDDGIVYTCSPSDFSMCLQSDAIIVTTVKYMLNRLADENNDVIRQFRLDVDLLILDEGHHVANNTWVRIVDLFPCARVVFMSGTPKRHDEEPLPNVPCTTVAKGTGMQHTMHDVADMTPYHGARFTLHDATLARLVKKLDVPVPVSGFNVEASFTVNGIKTTYRADDLDQYQRQARKADVNPDLFWQEQLIENVLKKALVCMQAIRSKYPSMGKLTAIVKAVDKDHASLVASIANRLGWNAVAYFSQEESDNPDQDTVNESMLERLDRFEDPHDPIDLCVQVNRLTEGYDNAQICMAIVLAPMNSRVAFEQFVGRALRLIDRKNHDRNPRAVIVYPDCVQLRSLVEDYYNMACSLSWQVNDKWDRPGGEREEWDPKPYAKIDTAEWVMPNEVELQKAVARLDPLDQMLRANPTTAALVAGLQPDQIDQLKSIFRSGIAHLDGYIPQRDAVQKKSGQQMNADVKEKRAMITTLVLKNISGIRLKDGETLGKVAGVMSAWAISRRWPSLRGGQKNTATSADEVAEFLRFDQDTLVSEAVEELNRKRTRH